MKRIGSTAILLCCLLGMTDCQKKNLRRQPPHRRMQPLPSSHLRLLRHKLQHLSRRQNPLQLHWKMVKLI